MKHGRYSQRRNIDLYGYNKYELRRQLRDEGWVKLSKSEASYQLSEYLKTNPPLHDTHGDWPDSINYEII